MACSLASNEVSQLTIAHYLASGKYPRHLRKLNNAIKKPSGKLHAESFEIFPRRDKGFYTYGRFCNVDRVTRTGGY